MVDMEDGITIHAQTEDPWLFTITGDDLGEVVEYRTAPGGTNMGSTFLTWMDTVQFNYMQRYRAFFLVNVMAFLIHWPSTQTEAAIQNLEVPFSLMDVEVSLHIATIIRGLHVPLSFVMPMILRSDPKQPMHGFSP